jgi:ubiquitin thioesterase protein OTUB1
VAFGYFETLFTRLDPIRVRHEMTRFKSLNTMLSQVGLQEHLYEIFTDATDELLTQTHQAIQNGEPDEEFLVNAFNDEYSANAVITHFRVCRSLSTHTPPARLIPFSS